MGRPKTADNSPIDPGRDEDRMRRCAVDGSAELLALLTKHHCIKDLRYQNERKPCGSGPV